MRNKKLDELLKDGGFEIKELIPEISSKIYSAFSFRV